MIGMRMSVSRRSNCPPRRDDIERIAAIACGLDLMTIGRQRARTEFAQRFFVFSYQNARHAMSNVLRRRRRGG